MEENLILEGLLSMEREAGTTSDTSQPGGNDKPTGCYRAAYFGITKETYHS